MNLSLWLLMGAVVSLILLHFSPRNSVRENLYSALTLTFIFALPVMAALGH